MIRPGSLDILPDCLDGRRLEPELPRRPDWLTLALVGILAVATLGAMAASLWETASGLCPLWILQGELWGNKNTQYLGPEQNCVRVAGAIRALARKETP